MKYYILTTTKFAKECIEFGKYGSTNSNWLSNINKDDVVFISQFNYKSQLIYGPFKVKLPLFYEKKDIYPNQKYYYRIDIQSNNLKYIEETDIYLQGINSKNKNFASRIINLLQQNKHLHSIYISNKEGEFILQTIKNHGNKLEKFDNKIYIPDYNELKVDSEYIANKNRLSKKSFFSSESDLEAFIIFSLKNNRSIVYDQLNKILNNIQNNDLNHSIIYNQFIFGNAYPSDIVIINQNNINILELKKTKLEKVMITTIEKEIKKYCYYSLYSKRIEENNDRQINFFLIILNGEQNLKYKEYLENYFERSIKPVSCFAKFSFAIVEYYVENQTLLFRKI